MSTTFSELNNAKATSASVPALRNKVPGFVLFADLVQANIDGQRLAANVPAYLNTKIVDADRLYLALKEIAQDGSDLIVVATLRGTTWILQKNFLKVQYDDR